MKHLFVSPHPDDAALSCGGLILTLTDAGDTVEILTIFSGCGRQPELTPYQRLALGFGEKGADGAGADGPTPEEISALRRAEDAAYARLARAQIRHVDLPDAVFRDYVGDEELFADPKRDDPAPTAELAAAVRAIEPDRVYLPLAVGSHVDHRLARRAGLTLLTDPETTRLPIERVRFYEDFPYSATVGFEDPRRLDAELERTLPAGHAFEAERVGIEAVLERKIANLAAYPSQLGRLFGGDDPMAIAVRERGRAVGDGAAMERYWRPVRK